MAAAFRNREPGQFNSPNYAFSVDFGGLGQALADKILASLYMIGRQTGIGCAARRGKPQGEVPRSRHRGLPQPALTTSEFDDLVEVLAEA